MESETSCPICELAHLPLDTDRCPQCDADLTCFRVLDALPEPDASVPPAGPVTVRSDTPEPAGKGRAAWRFGISGFLAGGAAMILAILLTGWPIWRSRQVENSPDATTVSWNKEITRIESKLDVQARHQEDLAAVLLAQIEKLDRKLSEIRNLSTEGSPHAAGCPPSDEKISETSAGGGVILPPTVPETALAGKTADRSVEFISYRAKETDTLWKISKRFYGDGMYYPVLLTHNPEIAVYSIGQKDTLAILKDIRQVKTIYSEVAERTRNHLYWYYELRPGDDAVSLIGKYCPSQGGGSGGSCLDPDAILKPGQRVRIRLE